ncbi:ABHD17B [Symbiodinium pilosum]|uniref:ABHD17B protein n=1 Tax=Symbiodinium pilosum TaxID=2952 RepID=A0A812MEB1_SYMPI|nr:ABHD17B [Symbiodinium pilosum]
MVDRIKMLGDALPRMLNCLDVQALGSASMVCRDWAELSETCWRQVFAWRWLGSLFELRQVHSSWRVSCSSRARARRADLRVVSGMWHLIGTVRDNKGEMATEADCCFSSGSLVMQGQAVHRRQDAGGHRIILHGVWQGNLCADIVALGGKRKWCLAWKEKISEVPGAYHYAGQLDELPDGRAVLISDHASVGLPLTPQASYRSFGATSGGLAGCAARSTTSWKDWKLCTGKRVNRHSIRG